MEDPSAHLKERLAKAAVPYVLVALCFAFGAGMAFGTKQAGWMILTPVGAIASVVIAIVAVNVRNFIK
jgi:hypothetical protein